MATELTGRQALIASRRSWLMNQALFTMRRLLYGTTLGLIAAGAAAFKMGMDYNRAMQEARVALTPFFHDNVALNDILNQLWTIAKYTPFQIRDMTLAFRQMYPAMKGIGMTGQQTVDVLSALIDALSISGRVTPASLNRVAIALQHMAFQGRLTGMSVLQLARDGIPMYAILRKEFGLTGEQMHKIGALGIPANAAMAAIIRYIRTTPGYANAARRQALMTFTGLFSTFKDNISKTMGLAEKGWFRGLQNMTRNADSWFNQLNANLARTHDLFVALDQTITPRSHRLLRVWRLLQRAMHDLWTNVKALFTVFTQNNAVLVTVVGLLWAAATVLHIAARTTWIWVPGLQLLVAWLILAKAAAIGAAIATYEFTGSQALAVFWSNLETLAIAALYLWDGLLTVRRLFATAVLWAYTAATIAWAFATDAATIAAYASAAAIWAMNVALYANPIGIIILAVIALTAGLVILYFKWKKFHDAVNATARWLYAHWYILALIPVIGPFVAGTVVIVRNIHRIVGWLQRLVDWAKRAAHWLGRLNPVNWARKGLGLAGRAAGLVGLAGGGTVVRGGSFMVGERGREIVTLPGGAAVRPVDTSAMGIGPMVFKFEIPVRLETDGRVLAEQVARHETSVNARR